MRAVLVLTVQMRFFAINEVQNRVLPQVEKLSTNTQGSGYHRKLGGVELIMEFRRKNLGNFPSYVGVNDTQYLWFIRFIVYIKRGRTHISSQGGEERQRDREREREGWRWE